MSAPKFAPLPPIITKEEPVFGVDGERAVVVGQTHDGRTLYERKWLKQENVQLMENGEEVWARHPSTGEKTYPKRQVITTYYQQRFWQHDDGRGNRWIKVYHAPDPAEAKRYEDERKATQLQADLARAMVAEGMTVADLIGVIKGKAAEDVPQGPAPDPAKPYPQPYAPGRYFLSDGTRFQGKKAEAEAAEANLPPPVVSY